MNTEGRLLRDFPLAIPLLEKLFSPEKKRPNMKRLDEVHGIVETAWDNNIARLNNVGSPIRYLGIGEAPPPSPSGEEVHYFYHDCHGSWCAGITSAFVSRPCVLEDLYRTLAQKGFLLVDTLPFAMKYSTRDRNRREYRMLVKQCINDYLGPKLSDPRIKWASEVKIAFMVPTNAKAVMEVLPDGLHLPNGQTIRISPDKVATNGTNFPSGRRIREVFGLDGAQDKTAL